MGAMGFLTEAEPEDSERFTVRGSKGPEDDYYERAMVAIDCDFAPLYFH